jgi:hypothetical protein
MADGVGLPLPATRGNGKGPESRQTEAKHASRFAADICSNQIGIDSSLPEPIIVQNVKIGNSG